MIHIGVVVTERCQASSVYTVVDLIIAANFAAQKYCASTSPAFTYQLIGLRGRAEAYNGNLISSISKIEETNRPDIVILPGAFESVLSAAQSQKQLSRMTHLFKIIHAWHDKGSTIASVCTGNFILASSDISSRRKLTCHWASEQTANKLFPNESFSAEQLLIDHGDIVSAGGAMAVSQLVLYLICRFHSRELALATGKLMMIELNFDSQSRFAIFQPNKTHGDLLVAKLQKQIETEFCQELHLSLFASKAGIGERQLNRRFKKATSETPLSYLQRYRVEQVKIGLESTKKPINNLIWSVGYEDPTSFRRLFKRFTGLTMLEYRNRFSSSS